MSKQLTGLIEILEIEGNRSNICASISCIGVSCRDCPFANNKSLKNLTDQLKLIALLEK